MKDKKRNIAILGSTGSIGTQALDIISRYPDRFTAYALVANNRVELLIEQARAFQPEIVVIANETKYEQLRDALSDLPIKVWCGNDGIEGAVNAEDVDMVLTAMVGFSGLKPTISAITAGKAIALANKETLVVAGELITSLAKNIKRLFCLLIPSIQLFFNALMAKDITRLIRYGSRHQEALSGLYERTVEARDQSRSFSSPQLEHGAKNNHRLLNTHQ